MQDSTVQAPASSVLPAHQHPGSQNPFYNGLYSLILPGAGQIQSGKYTKGVIFLAVEATLITFALVNQHNGNKKTQEFEQYADQHWSAVRYAQWISSFGVSDYGPNLSAPFDYSAIANKDFSQINAWERGDHTEAFTHQLPKYGEQQYYELIGKYNQYKFGWDTYPDLNKDGIPDSDSGRYDDFIPQQMLDYSKERGKANDYYYAAGFAAGIVVINHVVSALDAFISTRSLNKEVSTSMGVSMQDVGGTSRLVSQLNIAVSF